MTQPTTTQAEINRTLGASGFRAKKFRYDSWMEEQGIPVYRGYYIEDLRTIELAGSALRDMKTAFVQVIGMEGINELRVTELAPGASSPP